MKIGKLSYLWACLFGLVFVAFKAGFGSVALSLLLSLACSGMLLMLLVNLNRVPKTMQTIVLVFGILAVLLIHFDTDDIADREVLPQAEALVGSSDLVMVAGLTPWSAAPARFSSAGAGRSPFLRARPRRPRPR